MWLLGAFATYPSFKEIFQSLACLQLSLPCLCVYHASLVEFTMW